MRPNADAALIRQLARELARAADDDTTVYLTGGATAVLHGWRDSTVDIDLRLEPDSDDLLRRIATVKDELHVNVELASPPDFIPEVPGWRERSPFAFSEGRITVRHFDPYSQALSKIWRGFQLDRADVKAMIDQGLVDPERLRELFDQIEPALFRYPSLDAREFRSKVERTLRT
ncbi:MAG: hypothetical protein M3N56_11920 [Actinomycetota bacterium]|nr:hypothetical protein [Actinomycetota bacterium]